MADVFGPLSGPVNQAFRFWSKAFSARGSQVGFVNLNFARSNAPEVEEEVLEEVGSYGKQLGRIGDAMTVLLARLDRSTLTPPEAKAIRALESLLDEVAAVKERHGRSVIRP